MKLEKSLGNTIQDFVDDAYIDAELQALMERFRETEVRTGVQDPIILLEIFDYLDNKLKTKIKATIN
jgi:hypothetical protein